MWVCQGVHHYSCTLCGIRWKGSQFYMQYIPRPTPKAVTTALDADLSASPELEDDEN